MHIDLRKYAAKLQWVVPATVLSLWIYGMWVYIHRFCVSQLLYPSESANNRSRPATAIGLMCTSGVLFMVELILWLQIVLVGSGKQPQIQPYQLLPLSSPSSSREEKHPTIPQLYQCDPHGYPLWCSTCQSVKPFRTHHSSQIGHCIMEFDHFCLWLGVSIGKTNYPLFVKFISYTTCHFIITFVTMLRFIESTYHDGNIIAVIILTFFGGLFTSTLTIMHSIYITKNVTSIEMLQLQRDKKQSRRRHGGGGIVPGSRYVCYLYPFDQQRYVIELSYIEYLKIWNQGSLYANWRDRMGHQSPITWIIPFSFSHNPTISNNDDDEKSIGSAEYEINHETIDLIHDKIRSGGYLTKFKAFGDG